MRYYIEFEKKGNIKYISHLDMQRLFKRAFKRAGIPIEYSQGFNPHPKMGFAQPLSLGYTASQEYIEFTTTEKLIKEFALSSIKDAMPQGIIIKDLRVLDFPVKSLAAAVTGAIYSVELPLTYRTRGKDVEEIVKSYLNQKEIIALKREKKSKQMVEKNIKDQIHWIEVDSGSIDGDISSEYDKKVILKMELDSGSNSNLSPEQVISSFASYSEIYLPREDIEVNRDRILFSPNVTM